MAEERKEEDDDGVDSFEALRISSNLSHLMPVRKKSISYSQPLDRDASISENKRRTRKHSLDENQIAASHNTNYDVDAGVNLYDANYTSNDDRRYHYQAHGNGDRSSSLSSGSNSSGSDSPQKILAGVLAMPEFVGSGGGQGIFKLPVRAAVNPARPPSLDLRPHPLCETQVGSFLRTIACTDSQIWAGQESGVRFWNFSDTFVGREEGIRFPSTRGDEESPPFQESSRTSPAMCLVTDAANRLIWSGHKDGKIRSWRMDQTKQQASAGSSFREGLTWQAHRTPVLSMVITSYGDLWSGSEGGIIKVWSWETLEKSLSLTMEERHMAALLVERSYIDLRSQVTVGGVCSLPAADVKYLVSDTSKSKVWSGSHLSFALWDSRTKELLKVFNIDGQVEARVDTSSMHDPYLEDEVKIKFISTSKKEKSQISFFQRSRNVLMGAADAVRRVATKGGFGDDYRRTEALTTSMDGMIWSGCANGSLVQWDGNGNRLREFQYHYSSVQCLCTYGSRLWVGYVSGTVQVIDLEGNLLGGWVAHGSPIIKIVVGGGYVFTLANHGGIRGWNLTSPGLLDDILRSDLIDKELLYTKLENLKLLVGTWNVGQERASHDSLISWLGSAASEVGVVVVGLQEIEMGAGFLAMAAAKETVGLEGSANGQWWLDAIGRTLDEGTTFERVGSRQLAGLLISVWARKYLRPHVGDVDAAAVPCGFGRAIGNKGAVGLRMRVYDRKMCFVNCHFAAHLEAVNRRNSDFDHIYRTMTFSRPSSGLHPSAAVGSSAAQLLLGSNASGIRSDDGRPDLSEADMVVFLGDFNYRLHGISYDEARDFVSQRCFDWLREKDQLQAEMKMGKVFQGMREGIIKFPPTYKFERHQVGLGGYDSGEKKRIPAWCDRILYRDSRSMPVAECSSECPVVSSILHYDACMDVTDSDHKPVRCIYSIDVAHTDELIKRQAFGEILESNEKIRSLLQELCNVPETVVSTNNIILQNRDTSILRITNNSEKEKAMYEVFCEGQSIIKEDGLVSELCARSSFGFPYWLKVVPAAGVVKPGQMVEVSVHHEELHTLGEIIDGLPQKRRCEDTRDKEVILAVKVTGSSSTKSRSHQIRVHHSFSSKTVRNNSR